MQKWEYRIVRIDFSSYDVRPQGTLDELGEQGWELVGIQVLPRGESQTHSATWIFKRPKEE